MKKVLEDLRKFEAEQEAMLQKAKIESEKRIELAKKRELTRIKEQEKEAEQFKEKLILEAAQKAKNESKKITADYIKKIKDIETKSAKNLNRSVEKIFSELLK